MNMKIDIGHPEFLLICGTVLVTYGSFGLGLTLIVLGIVGCFLRAGLRMHRIQEEAKAKEQLLVEANHAGEELGKLLASLFSGLSASTRKSDSVVH